MSAPLPPIGPKNNVISGKGGTLLVNMDGMKMRFTLSERGLMIKDVMSGGPIDFKSFTLDQLWDASAGQKTLFDHGLKTEPEIPVTNG